MRAFVRKPGVRFIDVDGSTHTAWCFNRHIDDESNLSFQVIRSEFDDVLLRNSESLGVKVYEGHRVLDADVDADVPVVTARDDDGTTKTFAARFVVDASGRETFLSNRLKTKTAHKELERTAVSCSNGGRIFKDTLTRASSRSLPRRRKAGMDRVHPVGHDRLRSCGDDTAYYRDQRVKMKADDVDDWRRALYSRRSRPRRSRGVLADAEMHAQPR